MNTGSDVGLRTTTLPELLPDLVAVAWGDGRCNETVKVYAVSGASGEMRTLTAPSGKRIKPLDGTTMCPMSVVL